ncbi:hypothetical protein [Burkholderia seminalis]|uniref:hypothetical protein n=1 Tax=Burkholderia seminalis TaxID=488731 RepID=UPI001452E65F|nr:hypothetical protein [Burkholderia seminalis]MCA8435120.1 hypothetical protein [Burkholderia seminalis]VWB77741.1 hypothetical protein BSE24067_03689 [Burkholderia seminalis]
MNSPRHYQLIPCPFCYREAAMRVSEGMFGGSCVELAYADEIKRRADLCMMVRR